jgi:hypothetical protein
MRHHHARGALTGCPLEEDEMKNVRFGWRALVLLGALSSGAMGFSDAARAQEWQWSVTPYMWASEVGVDASINDHEVLEREADLADVLDSLDFMVQVHFEGQKGRHGLLLDLIYNDLGDDDRRFPLNESNGGEVVVKGDLEMTILEAGGIFNPRGDGGGFAFLYGARVIDLDEELDARYELGDGSTPGRRYSASTTLLDGMVGARYVGQLSERWSFHLRADASAGGSELTWNAWTGVGYAFGAAKQHAFLAGYRYMEIEFEEDDARAELELQNKLGGFIAGVKFGF